MRASVSSTREPIKRGSCPSSEQGLSECRQSGGAFDHEFTQTPLAKRASFSGSLVAEEPKYLKSAAEASEELSAEQLHKLSFPLPMLVAL